MEAACDSATWTDPSIGDATGGASGGATGGATKETAPHTAPKTSATRRRRPLFSAAAIAVSLASLGAAVVGTYNLAGARTHDGECPLISDLCQTPVFGWSWNNSAVGMEFVGQVMARNLLGLGASSSSTISVSMPPMVLYDMTVATLAGTCTCTLPSLHDTNGMFRAMGMPVQPAPGAPRHDWTVV